MLGSVLDFEFLTLQSVGRQLTAMPNQVYLIRLIYSVGHRPALGQRLWTAQELARNTVVRFLRAHNGRADPQPEILTMRGPGEVLRTRARGRS